jgi:thiol-disulfide isomerase/thioredoxin
MSVPHQPPPLPKKSGPSNALAWVSLGLGSTSLLLGLMVVGVLAGLAGLILGIMYLARKPAPHRAAAIWGILFSSLGLAMAVGSVLYAWMLARTMLADGDHEYFDAASWIGKPVPDLVLTATDGRTIRTAELKGHPAVIDMWASWHPSCEAAVPDFNRLAAETSSQGVHVVAITFENPTDVAEFAQGHPLQYPLVVTNDLPPPFGTISLVPTTFFLGADGVIRHIQVGYDGYDALKAAALGNIPGAEAGAPATTKDAP